MYVCVFVCLFPSSQAAKGEILIENQKCPLGCRLILGLKINPDSVNCSPETKKCYDTSAILAAMRRSHLLFLINCCQVKFWDSVVGGVHNRW